MKKMCAVLLLALPGVGCAYLGDRGKDFLDCWRFEGSVGMGVQADVSVGELAHVGVGSSRRWTAGLVYGDAVSDKVVEDHLPLSFIWTLAAPDTESLHSVRIGEDAKQSQHRCYMVLSGELNRSTWRKDPVHYFDLEVGVFAFVVGVKVGFSLGEFMDFLFGWFGADIGNDDGDRRDKKRWYHPSVPEPLPQDLFTDSPRP